jgi:hypothetical protein
MEKLILTIKSGIIEVITMPKNLDIEIRDYDILDCNPPDLKKDENGNDYYPIYF